jgi:hypothetical protein
MAVEMTAQAEGCRPGVPNLTVFIDDSDRVVSREMLDRAKTTVGKILGGAGVTVFWAEGGASDSRRTYCGEGLGVVFETDAPRDTSANALAYANLNAGGMNDIHVFFSRVSRYRFRQSIPEFLGHVLAHEIAHLLQGAARHSKEGVMKAQWSFADCAGMADRPLQFSPEDVRLIDAHFKRG